MSTEPKSSTAATVVSMSGSTRIEFTATAKLSAWKHAPPEHPIYALIGQVANAWSHLEHKLDLIIWDLMDCPKLHGACLTAQIGGLHNRIEAIKALLTVQNFSDKSIKKLNSFQGKSRDPQEWRNRIVHDAWFVEHTSGETAQFKALPRKDLRYGIKPTDKAFIDKALKAIAECHDAATALRVLIRAELQASRKKHS